MKLNLIAVLLSVVIPSLSQACPPEGCPTLYSCCRDTVQSGGYTGCQQSKQTADVINNYWGGNFGVCGTSGCITAKTPEEIKALETVGDKDDQYYHGFISNGSTSVEKTPTGGRATSAMARVDVCWNSGYSVTNNMTNRSGCYSSCDNGTTNYSCSGLTGADSCYGRCDAAFASE